MLFTLRSLWAHRSLIQRLAWRDILTRYKGSAGGLLWALITPILLLSVYTAVFSGIFQARWGQTGGPVEYALQLFVGLTIHGVAAECLNRAPVLIASNASYVKRVVFPLQVLPLVNLLSALFHFAISVVVLVVFYSVVKKSLPVVGLLYLPFIVAPYIVFLAGISYLLAGLGVYLRDIGQIMGLVTTLLLFLSPVFYPASMLPERLQTVFMVNPLTLIIEQSRAVLLDGLSPNWGLLGLYTVGALAIGALGIWAFQKMRKGFADVL